MELTWKGYVITLRIQTKRVEDTPESAELQVPLLASDAHRREKISRHHLLASGTRHTGPSGPPHL
jgi:hypothetical protein